MFVDTNVFVYARNPDAPRHHQAKSLLENASHAGEPIRISGQIIREYLATVTRAQPWAEPMHRFTALHDARLMVRDYQVLDENPRVTRNLIEICRHNNVAGRQIHDANIVSTMLTYGETRLLTFDVADFSRFEHLIEILYE